MAADEKIRAGEKTGRQAGQLNIFHIETDVQPNNGLFLNYFYTFNDIFPFSVSI